MLLPSPDLRIWLYAKPVDMRQQFDGLIVLAKHQLQLHASPMSGELFVLINRKQIMMKVLYFSRGGYYLWNKRLELDRTGCRAIRYAAKLTRHLPPARD